MASFPPSAFDRATGVGGQPGTPTPAGAAIAVGSIFSGSIEEMPDSPEIEFGEHTTYRHTFKCDYQTAIAILAGNFRGQALIANSGLTSIVLTSRLLYQKGDYCVVEIVAEGSDIPPPNEFDVEYVEFNPSIFLHPTYKAIANYTPDLGPNQGVNIGPQLIGAITNAASSPSFQQSQDQAGAIASLLNGTSTDVNTGTTEDEAQDLADELVAKLQRGEETFYLAGWRVTFAEFFFQSNDPNDGLIGINPGGYTEDPVHQGNLPPYFWSNTGIAGGQNILTSLAQQVNPTMYPPALGDKCLSWLRQADHVVFERVWFKYVHSWVGGPQGVWDSDLYPPSPAPFQ